MVERKFDLTKDAVTAKTVAPNSVGNEELKDGAVTTPKIANAPDGISETKINDSAVTGAKIANGAVATADLADDAVTAPKLQCIKFGIVSINPPSIAATSTSHIDVSVSGLAAADKVMVCCQGDLENGLVPIAAYCVTDGTLTVRISNWSSAAIDGVTRNWLWVAFKG